MEMEAINQSNRVLRLPAVRARTGLSASTAYEGIAAGTFPRPIKIGPRAVGWLESEIDAWLAARVAERDNATTEATV